MYIYKNGIHLPNAKYSDIHLYLNINYINIHILVYRCPLTIFCPDYIVTSLTEIIN